MSKRAKIHPRGMKLKIVISSNAGTPEGVNEMVEWIVHVPGELEEDLKRSLLFENVSNLQGRSDSLIFTVDSIGKLKIEIFANEHAPPHFRVSCSEGSCRFRISDGASLDPNGLSKYFSKIKAWHKEHKKELIDIWNARRPSDCPVGEYRE